MMIVMAGLPGTGKSALCRALVKHLGGAVLDKDLIRSTIFPEAYVEYSDAQDDFCQSLMLQTAAYLFERHPELRIFLDGRTFSRRYQIENAIRAAGEMRVSWRVIECVCPEETARQRLESETAHPARNRTYDLYRRLRDRFEPITVPKLVVNTDRPLGECVAEAVAYLMP
ncbi:MAG TPA: AAA family ATPase [Bryobacteraceae bacterium]|nr:AAA family ATPase [Bryobacteraceae bacterium]